MIIGLVSLIVFLFCLYQLTRDDFVFLRKNVSVEQMFNLTFLGLPIVLLFARIFYVVGHPSWHYLNPLVFFILPYFPGLSLPGGIVGALLFMHLFTRKGKMPQERVIDVLLLAFLISLTVGGLLSGLMNILLKDKNWIEEAILAVGSFVTFALLLRRFMEGKWLDGLVGYTGIFFAVILQAIAYAVVLFVTRQPISIGRTIPLAILLIYAVILLAQRGKALSRTFKRK